MAIVNRDKDPSEQRVLFQVAPGLVGVSALIQVGIVGCASQLLVANTAAFGLSGSPIIGLQVQRFITGVGNTVITLSGSSLTTVTAYSTSGAQAQALPASGSTLLQLLRGDVIQAVTSGANSAATYVLDVVIQVLQDIKSDYGV